MAATSKKRQKAPDEEVKLPSNNKTATEEKQQKKMSVEKLQETQMAAQDSVDFIEPVIDNRIASFSEDDQNSSRLPPIVD